jgi:hypothetical protein
MTPKKKKSQETDDLASVLGSTAGRRFINRLLSSIDSAAFCTDPHDTAYRLGLQHTARTLETELRFGHLESYMLMLRESLGDPEETTCSKSEQE